MFLNANLNLLRVCVCVVMDVFLTSLEQTIGGALYRESLAVNTWCQIRKLKKLSLDIN